MRNVLRSGLVVLVLVSMTHGAADLMAAEERLSLNGHAITSHQVIDEGRRDYKMVKFSTTKSVPGGEFWALIPGEVLAGKIEIITIYWHGDDLLAW